MNRYYYVAKMNIYSYTGAPYFAAIAATLLGADMAHVICEAQAATVIKSYSPDLMVHPYLYNSKTIPSNKSYEEVMDSVRGILDRVHVIVVGPGLGRDVAMQELAARIIGEAKKRDMPIVLDADGLYLVQNRIELINGYKNAVLTPNVMEFKRLQKVFGLESESTDRENDCLRLCQALGGVAIIEKGGTDYISNGKITINGELPGSLKRVGGQGDTLSGTIATFMAWKKAYLNNLWDHDEEMTESDLTLLSLYGGSCITRTSAHLAYERKGRSMLASDLSGYVGEAYNLLLK